MLNVSLVADTWAETRAAYVPSDLIRLLIPRVYAGQIPQQLGVHWLPAA